MSQSLTPPPQTKIKLADFDARHIEHDLDKEAARSRLQENTAALADLAYRLYAENRRAVLLVLQGMDTSGKDGTIRAVTTGVNPQAFQITAFKQPSAEELDHDFLWRIHNAAPNRGHVGIFNRSHYEDVLIVRVHKLVSKEEWQSRYERINSFERLLAEGGMTLVKCFLHISKDEQKKRLQSRLDDPTKRWKFSRGDLDERKLWNDYQEAYEEALTKCNTDDAPWHIVPADRKWYRNLVVSDLLRAALEKMDPQFPPEEPGLDELTVE
ncbi:MAG: polyphosphate kinase 2 family protein [Pirellulales bacterium]|nr:polyphosphate kinase 2 family protein [Pirellulales bacterium]